MPTNPDKIIDQIIETIDGSIADFHKALPGVQQEILDSIIELSKDFTIPANTVKSQVANLRLINKISTKINELILSPEYVEEVTKFAKSFETVSVLQNKYFNAITEEFEPTKLLAELKNSYVYFTIESLTEAGIDTISANVKDILLRNITSGGSYSSMVKEMTGYLTDNEGALVKYTRQITTDSLNQYSASYTKAVTDDLGLEWFRYVGSNINTTRPFCLALTAKDFYHEKELPEILKGHIGDKNVPINPKTGLWNGAIEGTNKSNFQVNRGGWQCGHQAYPVSEAMVPKSVRVETYDRIGIDYDDDGFAV